MRLHKLFPLALSLSLLLSACGGAPAADLSPQPEHSLPAAATPTPDPTPTPTPEYTGPRNPLTGEPLDEAYVNRRPVAVMLTNLKGALPQLGVAQADILYECITEGGITRMLGVWQDPSETGAIGSIRSAGPTIWSWPWGMTPSLFTPGAAPTPMTKSVPGASPPWTGSTAPTAAPAPGAT